MIARRYTSVALLALLAPVAAMADITDKTVTVPTGQFLNLDTGSIVSSGGDFKWDGLLLTPQGSAKYFYVGPGGDSSYNALSAAVIGNFKSIASVAPLAVSQLTGQAVIAFFTNGGNVAKLEVTSSSAPTNAPLPLKFTTYGASGSGGGTGAPTVTKILNNYSQIPNGFVNSGVAPSTLVAVFGSNFGDPPPASGLTLNSTLSPGIPTTSAGASATITSGGKTYPMPLYYACSQCTTDSPSKLAGVIPAAVPVGPATLTVSYKGQTSAPFSFNVVANALGLGTYGPGTVIATDALTGVLVDYVHAAIPGRTYVFWGSGGGADPADSDSVLTGTPHAVNQSVTQYYFGGTQGNVLYSGSSGYPALMQMNVTIPSNVATGCGVSVVAVVNGIPSNIGPLPIDGSGICHDPVTGISGTDLNGIGGQSTIRTGSVFVGSITDPPPTGTTAIAEAAFSSTTGVSYSGGGTFTLGSCTVLESDTATATTVSSTPLNPGTITLTGPGISTTLQSLQGFYFSQLSGGITAGGTYTFTGAGGPDVGPFSASVTMPNPLLTWTNSAALATVTRSGGVQVSWTGGAAGSYVIIQGSSSSADGSVSGSFTCYAPQSAGGFQVPSYVVSLLPAGKGSLALENSTLPAKFTAPKIDQAFASGFTGTQINVTYN